MDPMFRQRLRHHYLDLKTQLRDMEPGSQVRFDLERALAATSRLHCTLYKESIDPKHWGPHPSVRDADEA